MLQGRQAVQAQRRLHRHMQVVACKTASLGGRSGIPWPHPPCARQALLTGEKMQSMLFLIQGTSWATFCHDQRSSAGPLGGWLRDPRVWQQPQVGDVPQLHCAAASSSSRRHRRHIPNTQPLVPGGRTVYAPGLPAIAPCFTCWQLCSVGGARE